MSDEVKWTANVGMSTRRTDCDRSGCCQIAVDVARRADRGTAVSIDDRTDAAVPTHFPLHTTTEGDRLGICCPMPVTSVELVAG